MNRNRAWFAGSAGLVVVALASGCDTSPGADLDPTPLDHVTSGCDDHGNRVYKWQSSAKRNGIAVVGSDPTCQTTVTR